MHTAESELLRKENNTARYIPTDLKILEAKIPRPKAVTMLTIRPEKLSRSTKFYALKARRFRSF